MSALADPVTLLWAIIAVLGFGLAAVYLWIARDHRHAQSGHLRSCEMVDSVLADPVAVLWLIVAVAAFVAAAVYLWIGLRP